MASDELTDSVRAPVDPESAPVVEEVRVVGVGASAGGLDALTAFVAALPVDPGFAVAVVTHLDPTHESGMVALLSKASKIPVRLATEGQRVAPNAVYVIPPNANLRMQAGALRVEQRVADEGRLEPIDTFFRSLAVDAPTRAAAVVLSGTGSDGAQGVVALRSEGGATFAQDASAAYEAMPRAAVATGCVDMILPPEAIARELVRRWQHPELDGPSRAEEEAQIQAIFELLRVGSRMDFSHYKRTSFLRRVQRRMQIRRVAALDRYVELLRAEPAEVTALSEDVLIHVTRFFRDPEVFEALQKTVFPRMVEGRARDAPLRVWVPGCSSGEEVYSLAMALMEFLDDAGLSFPIKIFGTDIGEQPIERARAGRYANLDAEISPARLTRFFTAYEGGFQIRRDLRDLCIFARHDVTRDPPFAEMDLVSCRNLLIYLDATLQARVLPVFHYALRQGGFLVLGGSESAGEYSGFTPLDLRHKLYARSGGPSRLNPLPMPWAAHLTSPGVRSAASPSHGDILREADRVVLAAHGPPGVVVTADLAIVHFRGSTGPYTEHASGPASLDLLHVAREDLRFALRRSIDEVRRTGAVAREVVANRSAPGSVEVEVLPLVIPALPQRFFVVLFRDIAPTPTPPELVAPDDARRAVEQGLRQELSATREYLQSVVEQLEANNEELRVANEEILSSNEELHSTNEELQVAKEELQASNEELTTVNVELRERNAEATRLSDDLANVLSSVGIPIVFVGRDGRVRRFNPAAGRTFGLSASDVGAAFDAGHLRRIARELAPVAAAVQESLSPRDVVLCDDEGRWHQATARAYVTSDGRVDGVIMALFDIDRLKTAEQASEEARDFAEGIVATVREGLLVLDHELTVVTANRAYHEAFATGPQETQGRPLRELGEGQWDIPELIEALRGLLAAEGGVAEMRELRIEKAHPKLGRRILMLNARRMQTAPPKPPRVLMAFEDVTDRERVTEATRDHEEAFRQMLASAAESVLIFDAARRVRFANGSAHRAFGYAPDEMLGMVLEALVPARQRAQHIEHHQAFLTDPSSRPMGAGLDLRALRKDGTEFPVEVSLAAMSTVDGPRSVAFITDISKRREQEARLSEYNEKLKALAFDNQVSEERERRRIAADLHDQIGQTLSLVQIRLTGMRDGLDPAQREELDACVKLVAGTVADTRTLIFDLSPPILYDLGLAAALGWLADQFAQRHGLRVTVQGAEEVHLDPEVAAVLFRVVRELLTNIVKHSGSSDARVALGLQNDHVVVEVEDSGVGFGATPTREGFGLFSMREQIQKLRGMVEISTAISGGARVVLTVPQNIRRSTAPEGPDEDLDRG